MAAFVILIYLTKIVVPFTKVGLREGRVVYPDAVAGIFFSLFTLNMKSY